MKNWRFWLGVLVSLFFLGWVLKDLLPEIELFWAALRQAQYIWLIPGVLVYFFGVWARAWRWHYLLRRIKPVPTRVMFPIVAIGYMGNNIYPARAGEVLRAVVLKRREGISVSASLATIIVERIFDGLVMLAFVFVNLPELSRLTANAGVVGTSNIRQIALGGAGIFFGALVFFLTAAMFPQRTQTLTAWLVNRLVPLRWRERTLSLSERFLTGLEALRSPIDVWMIFFTSVVIWLFETSKYWFVMHAFPFEVSFFALMLMNGIVNLATTLPSAPGYIGTFDKPGIAVLEAYGVNTALASSYTIVLHIALWLPITALGAYYLWREGLRWEAAIMETQ